MLTLKFLFLKENERLDLGMVSQRRLCGQWDYSGPMLPLPSNLPMGELLNFLCSPVVSPTKW